MTRSSCRAAPRTSIRAACILLAVSAATAAAPARAEGPAEGEWNFQVLLDDKPIGTHRFRLRSTGEGQRELRSEARFDVKLLGFTAYRYRHEATERWSGDCLSALSATTDDDGKALSVRASKQGDALALDGPKGKESLSGCVMSFAYWHPAMRSQSRLLNAQTGEYERVTFESLGDAKIESQGKTVEAKHIRLSGPEQPVELWYAADGDWLGLASSVSGGKRKLVYRRQ